MTGKIGPWTLKLQAVLFTATALALFNLSARAQTNWKLPDGTPYDKEATLRVGHGGPAVNLDPHLFTATGDQTYTFLIFDRLTRLSRDGKPEGMLATSWNFAPDGSFLELQLRTDVSFHDGTKFDANAVKVNIERAKTVNRSTAAPLLAPITKVEVIEPHKVRLYLAPNQGGTLPTILATAAGSMISPKALSDSSRNLSLDPGNAGSGPYVVTRFKPNEFAHYELADKVWDQGAGLVRKIEAVFYPTNSARLRAIQTKALDFGQILGSEVAQADALIKKGDFQGYYNYGTSQTLFLRASRPPLTDVRVRRAILMAINRKAIADAVFRGNCPEATQVFKDDDWAHAPGYVDFKFDPGAAKKLLEEAGASNVTLDIVAPARSQYEQEALIVQSQLKEIGVNVTVSPMSTGDAITAFREGRVDSLLYNTSAQAHPVVVLLEYFVAGYGVTPDGDKAATRAVIEKAIGPTTSQDDQAKLIQEVSKMIGSQATAFPICWSPQLWTADLRVLNLNSVPKVGTARDFRFLAIRPR